jgi:hypothetical protein
VSDIVKITKVDEAFIHIEGERSLLQELSDYFTFYVPGYQFTPAYKSRYWDGKIRMLDLRTNKMYHGLVPYIEKFCEERDYQIEVDTSVNITEPLNSNIASACFGPNNPPAPVIKHTLLDKSNKLYMLLNERFNFYYVIFYIIQLIAVVLST